MADHLVDGPPNAKRQKLDPFQGPSDSSGKHTRRIKHLHEMFILYSMLSYRGAREGVPTILTCL